MITQPRRLAAVSVCKRVCDERRWRMGTICGFKFQTDRKLSSKTRILYLTTGSLIQSIISNEDYIKKYTHVILDGIHERDLDTDLIILLLKMKILGGFTGKVIFKTIFIISSTSEVKLNFFVLANSYVSYFRSNNLSRIF